MKNTSFTKIMISSIFLFVMIGIVYALLTPKIYSSKSHVALFRLKIEDPDAGSEESRNRWIWIRDGLNLKSALVPDSMLESIVMIDPTAHLLRNIYSNKQHLYDCLKKMIDIQFTGADENNFLVEVKAPSPELAFSLNVAVFKRIKYLAIEADQKKFDDILLELKSKELDFKVDPTTAAYFEDKIKKMKFNHIIEQKQREQAFEVLVAPSINNEPIWPKAYLIILSCLFIGIVAGLATEFILRQMQDRNEFDSKI